MSKEDKIIRLLSRQIELLEEQKALLDEQNNMLQVLIKESTGAEVLRKYRRTRP